MDVMKTKEELRQQRRDWGERTGYNERMRTERAADPEKSRQARRRWKEKTNYNDKIRADRATNPEKYRARGKRYRLRNKDVCRVRDHNYRFKHAFELKEQTRLRHLKWRIICLYTYSNGTMKCARCGTDVFEHLAIDHIDGGGTKHRQLDPVANCDTPRFLRDHEFPSGYRVLCHNCNFLMYLDGIDVKHIYMARHRENLKITALIAYANGRLKCAECEVNDTRILTLDHINGGGREQLRELKVKGGADFYRRLRVTGFPSGFQVLCFNHNCGKRIIRPSPEFMAQTIEEWRSHDR